MNATSALPAAPAAAPAAIMDVGMHRGGDTAFYLAKGFRVVAVEANPALVEAARARFASAIAAGRLTIVHCAIAERAGAASFWAFPGRDEWGTLDPAHAERNRRRGIACEEVSVVCLPFRQILAQQGTPYYLKIDIEGADLLCLRDLLQTPARPRYVSIELPLGSADEALEPLALLHTLGYRRFQLVDQALHPGRRSPQPPREGSYVPAQFNPFTSGLFGRELPGAWRSATHLSRRIPRLVRAERLWGDDARWHSCGWVVNALRRLPAQWRTPRIWRHTLTTTSWFDLHATF